MMSRRTSICALGIAVTFLVLGKRQAFGWDEPKALEHTKDTLEEVKKRVSEKKAILVDVRELAEWKAGHIVDAVLLPIRELESSLDEKKLKENFKDKIVYIYCAAGVRSLRAGKILHKLGLDIRPLKQGYEELVKAGFKNEK